MAKKNRVDLNAVIQSNLPDNTTDFITPALDREVEIDEIDSCFNLEDDTAIDVNYTPTTPADWDITVPTETGSGLDQVAKRMRIFETNNFSDSVFYVSKQGDDLIAEEGNPAKPFLTLQAAADAMPSNNASLIVLGGGTYSELSGTLTLKNNSTNCLFDFGQCVFTGAVLLQVPVGANNCIFQNLIINDVGVLNSGIHADYVENIRYTSAAVIGLRSNLVTNSFFTSSFNLTTIEASETNFRRYFINCVIKNTGAGNCIQNLAFTSFLNCTIEANTGLAISTRKALLNETIKVYNCEIKSQNFVVGGSSRFGNLMAYNTKFYSATSNIQNIEIEVKFLLFQGCEFYTKSTLSSFKMTGLINRTALENFTFKECTFNTVTGYPIQETAAYDPADLGTTLLVNCVYNALTVTTGVPVKVTEHNSFSFPNYTDFNNLQ
jgi:hypothetical protein